MKIAASRTGKFFFLLAGIAGLVLAPCEDGVGAARAVRHGDVLVQKDTDLMRSIAQGSDGSRASVMTHAQLTINANGETTVHFEIDKMVCD